MDDRDRRLKEIEKAGAIQGAGLAQNELASMAQEQKGNLLQEKQALMQQAQERATIAQAAEMGIDTVADLAQQQQGVAQQQPAMNTQTQQILSKYGINPSQKPKSSSTVSTRNISKQGPTTVENITNTVTTNRNEIKIVQPNIPVQQPQINFRNSSIKFKTWLQKANQQQEELANSQMNEYNRRERGLERSTSRMMRKLQELSKKISDKMDPENMVNSVSGSLKTFLFLYIATILPMVWKPIMNGLDSLEADFRRFFGLPMPKGLEGKALGGGKSKVTEWKEALGMKGDLDTQSIFSGVKKLIGSSFDRLMKELELQKEDREKAIQRVQKDKPESLTDIQGWLKYLGNVIVAAIGGSEGQATFTEGARIEKEKTEEIKESQDVTINGEKISMKGEFDEEGNLRDEDSALKMTQYLGSEIGKDTVDIGKIQTAVEKLRKFSSRNDKLIPLTPEIAKQLNSKLSEKDVTDIKNKYAKKGEYAVDDSNYVYKRKTSDYDPGQEYSILGRIGDWTGAGTAAGTAAGLVFGGISAPAGAFFGSLIGAGIGTIHGLGEAVYHEITGRENMQMSLVSKNDLTEKEQGWLKEGKYVYPAKVEMISPDMLSELLGMKEGNAFSVENYQALEKSFSDKKLAPIDKSYQEVVSNVSSLNEKREALKNEDTEFNTVLNNFSNKEEEEVTNDYYHNPTPVSSTTPSSPTPTKTNVQVGRSQEETAEMIINYLMNNLGITREQASGIVGNLHIESGGFNINALGDRGTSFGIAQWHNERRDALFEFTGTKTPSLEQQIEFLAHELKTSESRALKKLKEARTVEESAMAFAKHFERPATGKDGLPLHFDRRWGYAEKYFALNPSSFTPSTPVISSPSYENMLANNNSVNLGTQEELLGKIANSTKELAEVTGISAQLDAIPRQQIINNVTPPTNPKHEVGWSSTV